jgi:hypothetical protein
MGDILIVNTRTETAAHVLEDYLLMGRNYKPEWFKGTPASKCPGLRSMINNSLILLSPVDIEIQFNTDGGGVSIELAGQVEGGEALISISHNDKSESGELYKFWGDVIQFKLEYAALMTPQEGVDILEIVSTVPLHYMKGVLEVGKHMNVLSVPGVLQVTPKFPLNPICMMIVKKESPGTRVLIKKGTPIGMYYFTQGLKGLQIKANPLVTKGIRTSFSLGTSFNDAVKLSKCPRNTLGGSNG